MQGYVGAVSAAVGIAVRISVCVCTCVHVVRQRKVRVAGEMCRPTAERLSQPDPGHVLIYKTSKTDYRQAVA